MPGWCHCPRGIPSNKTACLPPVLFPPLLSLNKQVRCSYVAPAVTLTWRDPAVVTLTCFMLQQPSRCSARFPWVTSALVIHLRAGFRPPTRRLYLQPCQPEVCRLDSACCQATSSCSTHHCLVKKKEKEKNPTKISKYLNCCECFICVLVCLQPAPVALVISLKIVLNICLLTIDMQSLRGI